MVEIAGAFAGGFFGFLFAYLLALKGRKWEKERGLEEARKKVREERRRMVSAVRTPLHTIKQEILSSYNMQGFFNRSTEDGITRDIMLNLYALQDSKLDRLFEQAKRPLHDFAQATTNTQDVGKNALPHIEALLNRLDEMRFSLDSSTTHSPRRGWWQLR